MPAITGDMPVPVPAQRPDWTVKVIHDQVPVPGLPAVPWIFRRDHFPGVQSGTGSRSGAKRYLGWR